MFGVEQAIEDSVPDVIDGIEADGFDALLRNLRHVSGVNLFGEQLVTESALVLILTTLLAATVNGALGYGFSSITVPVALLIEEE